MKIGRKTFSLLATRTCLVIIIIDKLLLAIFLNGKEYWNIYAKIWHQLFMTRVKRFWPSDSGTSSSHKGNTQIFLKCSRWKFGYGSLKWKINLTRRTFFRTFSSKYYNICMITHTMSKPKKVLGWQLEKIRDRKGAMLKAALLRYIFFIRFLIFSVVN